MPVIRKLHSVGQSLFSKLLISCLFPLRKNAIINWSSDVLTSPPPPSASAPFYFHLKEIVFSFILFFARDKHMDASSDRFNNMACGNASIYNQKSHRNRIMSTGISPKERPRKNTSSHALTKTLIYFQKGQGRSRQLFTRHKY